MSKTQNTSEQHAGMLSAFLSPRSSSPFPELPVEPLYGPAEVLPGGGHLLLPETELAAAGFAQEGGGVAVAAVVGRGVGVDV